MNKINLLTLAGMACLALTACSGSRTTPCCDSLRKEYKPVLYFSFDSAQLTSADKHILQMLPEKIKKCPEVMLHVIGYTDDIGNSEYNLKLGLERANSVQTYLSGLGIKANRILVKSMGEKNPVASNTTEEGRMKNRRAVIKLK